MANKQIKQLNAASVAEDDDLLVIQQAADDDTLKITKKNFLGKGWQGLGYTPTTITYDGNRQYTLVFNNNDLTDTLSPGMKLRITRTVTAPTQCTDLERGSSQYWNDTSVNGMSFTDDFVAGAWVKLESYDAMGVISRYNGTSGWILYITAEGKVLLQGNNGGGANFSYVVSQRSIPLGKWVHIAAQLDMSAFTATSTTSYVMINGEDVPASVVRGGTNPTALIQAGNLEVGSYNAGAFFDGKIAQAFVSSAKITQANVRTLVSQGLNASLISTHSIVSAYAFDGNGNDLNTTNANNLTAQGGATAVNADSPFSLGADLVSGYTDGTTDFAIVNTINFSTNTTMILEVPEGCAIPTSGGISAVAYSTQDSPYGFPRDKGRWRTEYLIMSTITTSSPSGSVWVLNTGCQLSSPAGRQRIGYSLQAATDKTSAARLDSGITLSTANNSESEPRLTRAFALISATFAGDHVSADLVVSNSSMTTYYLNTYYDGSAGAHLNNYVVGAVNQGRGVIYTENAYI